MAKFSRIETIQDLKTLLKELATGLRQLSLSDNFESFEVVLDLAAGEERNNIRNQLKIIPTGYILKFQKGNGLVTAGDAEWNLNYISFKNNGSDAVSVRIQVLR